MGKIEDEMRATGDVVTFSIDATLDDLLKRLEHFEVDQLPYAKAGALFATALDARGAMLARLYGTFTTRTGMSKAKPWAERALHVVPKNAAAIKRDIKAGNAGSVTVATRSPLGALLSDGGVRKRKDSKDFGIPVLGGGRKTRKSVVRWGKNGPYDVLNKMKGFYLPADDPRNKLIYIRTAKYVKGEDDRPKKKLMFIMRNEVKIKPWWNLKQIFAEAMTNWLPVRFIEKCEEAMRTRKPRKT